MNIDIYTITPELLAGLIQKEHTLIYCFEDLINLADAKHDKLAYTLVNEEKEIYFSLVNLYDNLAHTTFNKHLIMQNSKPGNTEDSLLSCIHYDLELFSLYNLIVNNENNFAFKNFFTNLLTLKTKQLLLLNFLFSDYRGCNCQKNKRNIRNDHSNLNPNELMELYWEQHVWWTRNLIISIIDELKDEDEVTKRLLKNPKDIASLFRNKYGPEVEKVVNDLITEHLVIGKNLIIAVKQKNSVLASELDKKWYKNANDIAVALNSINPQIYHTEKWRQMLYSHLDMTKKEVEYRINGNYVQDIKNFEDIEREALTMAKEMTKGLQ